MRCGYTVLLLLAAVCLRPVRLATEPSLEKRVQQILAGFHGEVALAAKNLSTGQTFGVRENRRVKTASVIKLAVMVEAFWQVKEEKLRLDEPLTFTAEDKVPGSGLLQDLQPGLRLTLEDALTLMIVVSDNTAANLVLDKVGIAGVNQRMLALGLPSTKIFKKVFRPADHPLAAEQKEFGLGVTTPAEMVKLLEMIERRQVVDPPSCEKMLAILKKQRDRDQIPRYLVDQPKVSFALKSGALDDLRNDVGLLYAPGATLALAVFAYNSKDHRWTPDNEASLTIARIAEAVYNAWTGKEAEGGRSGVRGQN